jgi:hypothetical protein
MKPVSHIHLQPGQIPPRPCGWVLVERTVHGRFDVVACTDEGEHRRFDYEQGFFSLTKAIEHALPEAQRLGVSELYIQLDGPGLHPAKDAP